MTKKCGEIFFSFLLLRLGCVDCLLEFLMLSNKEVNCKSNTTAVL